MREETIRKALMGAGTTAMLMFCLLPFAYMVAVSFSSHPGFSSGGQAAEFTLRHYSEVLTVESLHFPDYLRNSLLISGLSSVFTVLIAALAAYAVTRLPVPGKMVLLFSVLAVSMFPQISLISYLFKVMTRLGWINTYPALLFPYIAWILPLTLWILVSYFAQIPKELDRAALVDGCTRRQILLKVIFPVAAPGLFSAGLLAFIFAFNEFLFALMLTTDHNARTIPVGIALFQGLHGQVPWGSIMAVSALTTVPIILLTLFFQRHMIQGLTRGAVKG